MRCSLCGIVTSIALVGLAIGCANETRPRSAAILSRPLLPDDRYPLPVDLSVSAIHASSSRNQLILTGYIGTGPHSVGVVLLTDSRLSHCREVWRAPVSFIDTAASRDGRYVAVAVPRTDAHAGSVELIDLETSNTRRLPGLTVDLGSTLQCSDTGHLLALADLRSHTVTIYNTVSGQECRLARLEYRVHFLDARGLLLCNSGDVVDLKSKDAQGCPTWVPNGVPHWDRIAFDSRGDRGYAGWSVHQRNELGGGYAPSKVVIFRIADGSTIRSTPLPFPESDDPILGMQLIGDRVLMIAQPGRIVLHHLPSMEIIAALAAGSGSVNGNVYFPDFVQPAAYVASESSIVAVNRGELVKWDLRTLKVVDRREMERRRNP